MFIKENKIIKTKKASQNRNKEIRVMTSRLYSENLPLNMSTSLTRFSSLYVRLILKIRSRVLEEKKSVLLFQSKWCAILMMTIFYAIAKLSQNFISKKRFLMLKFNIKNPTLFFNKQNINLIIVAFRIVINTNWIRKERPALNHLNRF